MTDQATEDVTKLFEPKEDKPVFTRKYACTVVSLIPREVFEEKPHMLPSTFRIPAAIYGDISILHVEEGTHYVPDPFSQRSLKQVTSPAEMARSICEDYNSAHIGTSENCGPSLFWVEGRLTKNEIKQHYKAELDRAKISLRNWFHALVSMADADWQKNHNMLAVSDLQRIAAQSLGIKKDWVEFIGQETKLCPFCKFNIAIDSIKCVNCKEVVDQKAYDKIMKGKD